MNFEEESKKIIDLQIKYYQNEVAMQEEDKAEREKNNADDSKPEPQKYQIELYESAEILTAVLKLIEEMKK